MQCTVYCTVLYCTILYCTVPYCTVRYCTVTYRTVLYRTVLYCTVPYGTVLVLYLYSTGVLYLYCTGVLCCILISAISQRAVNRNNTVINTLMRITKRPNNFSLIFFAFVLKYLNNYNSAVCNCHR